MFREAGSCKVIIANEITSIVIIEGKRWDFHGISLSGAISLGGSIIRFDICISLMDTAACMC